MVQSHVSPDRVRSAVREGKGTIFRILGILKDVRIFETVWGHGGSQQSFQLLMFSKKPNIYGYCLFDISVIHISIHFSLFSTGITARPNRPDRIAQ